MKSTILLSVMLFAFAMKATAQYPFEKDIFETTSGKLTIWFIGHGSLMLDFNSKIIYIDPWSKQFDYTKLPKADLILITHEHYDHLDSATILTLTKPDTKLIVNTSVHNILKKGTIMKNGETLLVDNIKIEAVPAYNTSVGRDKFHPKGRDNGYVLNLGNKRVYIAGDTENIPEMASLKKIDIAFLPMNQPYTMLPAQVAEAAKSFNPLILYPYHYGDTDVSTLVALLKNNKNIEVRVRAMK